jgi:hypothetical protein
MAILVVHFAKNSSDVTNTLLRIETQNQII